MFLLVGKMFPHPMGVFCTHLEPPKSHIRKNIFVPKFIYLFCFALCRLIGTLQGHRRAIRAHMRTSCRPALYVTKWAE